uniref:RxLR effector candidate protein n=1 Tax=Hyaloperonospora arabidopsidis (strain Emoy2) TaxID=559515 RepID=M4BWX9_HYAAE
MRLRSAAAGETGSLEAADVSSSAASATQPAAVSAACARGDAPRDIGDYDLELIYSGEYDGETDSKEAKATDEPELAKPEPTKSASRSALSLADRRDIFGSSYESPPPSPRRSRSAESEKSHGFGHWNDIDGDAIMPHTSKAPCRTVRQGPKHQPAVEREAPKYLPRVDTRATGRGNSSDVPSHRGGSTSAPRGSVGHCAHESMDEAEEETRPQTGLQVQSDTVSLLKRVTCELREDLEHERSRRLGLVDNVTRLSSEKERDRSDLAFAQLENERTQRSLRDELVEARQDISRLYGEIYELQTRADSQHREHKYLLEMLERREFLHRKKSRTGDTA